MDRDPPIVDATDQHIIGLLRENARRTYGDIGSRVGLSAPAVKRRVDRLETTGIITGYTALVDHAALGRPLEAFAELRFVGSAPVNAIEGLADAIPEIQALFTLAGDPDALVWLRVRDVQDLKRVIDRIRRTGAVTGTKTLMVLDSQLGGT
ncbi:MAG: Lrp/AsnC family transcriptional regulator [Acidimicrobiales bacterium]|nr:Lrp/AsnC family transcriptional regulator [Acidimicrobiales bacterium]